jgi:hypothetical protein
LNVDAACLRELADRQSQDHGIYLSTGFTLYTMVQSEVIRRN